MKRVQVLFVFLFFIVTTVFAQQPVYQNALEITRAQVSPAGYINNGWNVLEYVTVKNNVVEDVLVDGFEVVVETDGIAPHKIMSEVSLYDGSTDVGGGVVPVESMQSFFVNGGRFYLNASVTITSQSAKDITIRGNVCGMGKVKVVLSVIYGRGINTGNFYSGYGDFSYFEWRETNVQVGTQASITPGQRVVAPGSKRIKIPLYLRSTTGVRSWDANMVLCQNQFGYPKISFYRGFERNPWDYDMYNWAGDLRQNNQNNAIRLVLYGQNELYGSHTVYIYAGLSDVLKEGDKVPVSFSPVLVNDSFTPLSTEENIVVGPSIVFGDANADSSKEVTPGDVNATLDLMFGTVRADEQKLLRMLLGADVTGDGYPDEDDAWHQLNMIFDPYYLPPVLWNSETPVVGSGKTEPISIVPRRNGNVIEYYLSGPAMRGSITIDAKNIMKGNALDNGVTARIGSKDNKILLVFASRKNIDVSKPLFSVSAANLPNVSGKVDGMPLSVASITGMEEKETIPSEFSLSQNYPNPFNPSTVIKYSVGTTALVHMTICDVLGREVSKLVNEEKQAGAYEVRFDGSGLSSGVYFCVIRAGSFSATTKMILTK